MTEYFGLPERDYERFWYRPRKIVDRHSVEPARYRSAAASMNRSLKRLKARELIVVIHRHNASVLHAICASLP
jgi:hypothetical protein